MHAGTFKSESTSRKDSTVLMCMLLCVCVCVWVFVACAFGSNSVILTFDIAHDTWI